MEASAGSGSTGGGGAMMSSSAPQGNSEEPGMTKGLDKKFRRWMIVNKSHGHMMSDQHVDAVK